MFLSAILILLLKPIKDKEDREHRKERLFADKKRFEDELKEKEVITSLRNKLTSLLNL